MEKDKKRFQTSRWIILSIAILLNSFIIFYSCLSDKVTNSWSRFVSNIFTSLVNNATEKEVKIIPVTNVDLSTSNYAFNDIKGYEMDEIPLGSEKEIEAKVLPSDASNKAIKFTASNDNVKLNQSGSRLSIIGMKVGEVTITASSSDGAYQDSMTFKVIEVKEPSSFAITLLNKEIALGHPETISININGGDTLNTDLLKFQYYDITKLTYTSSNNDVATVDNHGVIYPVSEGSSTIKVSNHEGIEKTVDITVINGTPLPNYENLTIEGSGVCHENDLIKDRNSSTNYHHQLTIKNNDELLDNHDFIWESSNNLVARVDQNGVLRGFRKTTYEDETVTIKATNKFTKQEVSKVITVKKQLPETLYTCFTLGKNEVWSPEQLTVFIGDVINVKVMYDITVDNIDVSVSLSNEEIASFVNEGNVITLEFKKEGTTEITFTSNIVNTLVRKTSINVVKAGAIGKEDIENLNLNIRKSVGHAALFGLTQIFTFLAFYMFLYDIKIWQITALSLECGVLLAIVSELIQHFIPLRSGTPLDALIDIIGVIVGLALVLSITLIIRHKKSQKQKVEDNQ